MIYLNTATQEFINKNPGLFVKTIQCNNCQNELSTTIPFITKDYIGLATPNCSCGNLLSKAEVAIPRTEKEIESWLSFFKE